jgi:hypothetical protein
LVTPDFLASDFIHEHESVPLLHEAEEGRVRILWVPVRDSAYKQTRLKNYQAAIDPKKPLATWPKAKRDQAWVKICEEIKKAVNPSKEYPPEDSLKDAAPQSAPPIIAPLASPDRTPAERDSERIGFYQLLFDRPAFRFPCIFEGALFEIKAAVDAVSAAIATGTLYSRTAKIITVRELINGIPELLAKIPPRTDFETNPYRETLDEIRTMFSVLKRTIDELIDLLDDADGKKFPRRPFHDMESLLINLIMRGVSQSFVQKAFALMDRIDTERNFILKRVNSLFVQAGLPEIPSITTSTEQLRVSSELARTEDGRHRWDLFYLGSHAMLSEFLESGRSPRLRKRSAFHWASLAIRTLMGRSK